jgi:hypothetical protein
MRSIPTPYSLRIPKTDSERKYYRQAVDQLIESFGETMETMEHTTKDNLVVQINSPFIGNQSKIVEKHPREFKLSVAVAFRDSDWYVRNLVFNSSENTYTITLKQIVR